ncbi:MAG: baseplate J/gp47 family protein [Brevinema sp.]
MKKTQVDIVQEIIEQSKEQIPQITHYRSGGVFRLFIEVVASFLEKIYTELDELLPNRFLSTAKGKWLDLKAEELSLYRYQATKTKGYVIFSRFDTTSSITINQGKIISTNDKNNSLRYKVVADTILPKNENSILVLVEAEESGSQYNVFGGQISDLITPINGIDTITNTYEWIIEVGQDQETDENLRIRCKDIWAGLSGANKNAYVSWAKNVKGIHDVVIVTIEQELGVIKVVCNGNKNTPPSQEILNQVRNIIDTKKPIATKVEVLAPNPVPININLTVSMNPNQETSKDHIETAIRQYFENLTIGTDFEPSALTSTIFTIKGIKSIVVNTPSTYISQLQTARLGNLTIELLKTQEE